MRMYIRHPFDITMHFMAENAISDQFENERKLKDISEGGLCFYSPDPIEIGSRLYIQIPIREPAFSAEGVVTWCNKKDEYEVGVKFEDDDVNYNVRMVEQACHIKHYLRHEQKAGRELSTKQAVDEWLIKYADDFPSLSKRYSN